MAAPEIEGNEDEDENGDFQHEVAELLQQSSNAASLVSDVMARLPVASGSGEVYQPQV